jgi:excisionase family DNA binding protein
MRTTQYWLTLLGTPTGPVLRPAEAASYLGLSISSFYGLIQAGELPPLIKVGRRAAAMPKPWLDRLLQKRLAREL